jgi:hypothetical protein
MAFPHPQAGKNHHWQKNIPGSEGVAGKLIERAIDVAEYWDAEDNVDPAEDGS